MGGRALIMPQGVSPGGRPRRPSKRSKPLLVVAVPGVICWASGGDDVYNDDFVRVARLKNSNPVDGGFAGCWLWSRSRGVRLSACPTSSLRIRAALRFALDSIDS